MSASDVHFEGIKRTLNGELTGEKTRTFYVAGQILDDLLREAFLACTFSVENFIGIERIIISDEPFTVEVYTGQKRNGEIVLTTLEEIPERLIEYAKLLFGIPVRYGVNHGPAPKTIRVWVDVSNITNYRYNRDRPSEIRKELYLSPYEH